jgi:hypothetical protein
MAQHGQKSPVETDGGLHHVGNISFVGLLVEILDLPAGEFLMGTQVEIGPGMDSLQLLESDREIKLDIGSGVGVMSKFFMIVKTVFRGRNTQ